MTPDQEAKLNEIEQDVRNVQQKVGELIVTLDGDEQDNTQVVFDDLDVVIDDIGLVRE